MNSQAGRLRYIGPAGRRRSQAEAADAGPVFFEVLLVTTFRVRAFVQQDALAAVFPGFVLAAAGDALGADFHEQSHGARGHAAAHEFLARGFDIVHFVEGGDVEGVAGGDFIEPENHSVRALFSVGDAERAFAIHALAGFIHGAADLRHAREPIDLVENVRAKFCVDHAFDEVAVGQIKSPVEPGDAGAVGAEVEFGGGFSELRAAANGDGGVGENGAAVGAENFIDEVHNSNQRFAAGEGVLAVIAVAAGNARVFFQEHAEGGNVWDIDGEIVVGLGRGGGGGSVGSLRGGIFFALGFSFLRSGFFLLMVRHIFGAVLPQSRAE